MGRFFDGTRSRAQVLREIMRVAATPPPVFERLKARLPRVEVGGVEMYVAEGDLLLDQDELFFYSCRRQARQDMCRAEALESKIGGGAQPIRPPPAAALVATTAEGRVVRWTPGSTLTYAVLRRTFTGPQGDAHHATVVRNLAAAAREWEAVCDIHFRHLPALDDSDALRPEGVTFPVRLLDTGGALTAAAFFPNDPLARHRIVVDPSYFSPTLGFDPVGVFRHELGHVLGFRHEQIRSGAPPECAAETDTGSLDLTLYDPQSVMHYFCGGVGDRALRITELDRIGAQSVYGAPRVA